MPPGASVTSNGAGPMFLFRVGQAHPPGPLSARIQRSSRSARVKVDCYCTGFHPANSLDLVGQGCGAALPSLRTAEALLAAGHCQHVLWICVEVCSAAFFLENDAGVLISRSGSSDRSGLCHKTGGLNCPIV